MYVAVVSSEHSGRAVPVFQNESKSLIPWHAAGWYADHVT